MGSGCRNERDRAQHLELPDSQVRLFVAEPILPESFPRRPRRRRSLVACNTFGYLAGVGDRHLQNLLLEDASGTLVPIDFGYSFGTATSV